MKVSANVRLEERSGECSFGAQVGNKSVLGYCFAIESARLQGLLSRPLHALSITDLPKVALATESGKSFIKADCSMTNGWDCKADVEM